MPAPAAVSRFVEQEYPRLVRAVDLLLDDRAVAEEVAQEALLRATGRWEHVSGLESPGGWVHRVAINLATSHLRRRRIARRARARLAAPAVAPEPDTATAVTVRAALSRLPAAQRRVLVLRHVLGWSAVEIADLDRVRADAVRQQLRRAREALRAELGPDLVPERERGPADEDDQVDQAGHADREADQGGPADQDDEVDDEERRHVNRAR